MHLTRDERSQLALILGCAQGEVPARLKDYQQAAGEEYVRMILGQKVFTRGQDIREYRLFLLIQHVFGKRLPSDKEISGLFQTTATQSRALLRAVMSKFQYELQEAIQGTLADYVRKATQATAGQGDWSVVVDSENVVEALNREIAQLDGTLPQISKARGTVSTYEIANSSYARLKQHFGL